MPACLVIGGGGFIGSYLVRRLALRSKNIIVVGRSAAPRFELPQGVTYLCGDASDALFLSPILDGCDEVVDLAYSTVPKTSFDDPVLDVTANLPASVNLLKLASQQSLRKLVLISSGGTVYGDARYLPIDEHHPTHPVSPYGITKLALENYGLMYHQLSGLPCVVVRPGNPYGPGQMGNLGQGFVGACIYAALRNSPVTVFGERGTVRDYIYIEDLATGIVAALDEGQPGSIYNVGTGQGLDNAALLDQLRPLIEGDGLRLNVVHQPTRPFDVKANVLSAAKLTFDTGWRPQTSIATGLANTWAWAKNHMLLSS